MDHIEFKESALATCLPRSGMYAKTLASVFKL
jgi:hypothetical protein